MAHSQQAQNFEKIIFFNTVQNNQGYQMSAVVLNDDPIQINLEQTTSIEIQFNNFSEESQELRELIVYETKYSQLNSHYEVIPFVIDKCSKQIFFLSATGQFLGRSSEKVAFIFENFKLDIMININVVHPSISIPVLDEYVSSTKKYDKMRLHHFILLKRRVRGGNPNRPKKREIPSTLWKCYRDISGQLNSNNNSIQIKISDLYPEVLENLTYQNYKEKLHTLLFIHEIEEINDFHKYAQNRVPLIRSNGNLAIFIENVKEQLPLLIPGYKVLFTEIENSCKTSYIYAIPVSFEGVICSVHQHHVYFKLSSDFSYKFNPTSLFNTTFLPSRRHFLSLHDVVDKSWCGNGLGEAFLFPGKSTEYRAPKILMKSVNDIDATYDLADRFDLNTNLDDAVQPSRQPAVVIENIEWFNLVLNEEQKSAVINILKAEGRRLPYIIYGPPGTGKTITLMESIIQVYTNFPDSKILVCAPTNSSINKLLGMLVASKKISATSIKRVLSYTYFNSSSYTDYHSDYCVLPANYMEPRHEKSAKIADILMSKIILCTPRTLDVLKLSNTKCGIFTHIFLDEASQMTEPTTLFAFSMCDLDSGEGQVIMAGDPKQLGPVVRSNIAETYGLGQSMLARYTDHPPYKRDITVFPEHNGYNPKIITYLIRNYRSLPEIVCIFSDLFYESLVVATKTNDDVEERIFLNSLTSHQNWDIFPKTPVIVHGVSGPALLDRNNLSWSNPCEAIQVNVYLKKLHDVGVDLRQVGIVTPYSSQVTCIKSILMDTNPAPKVGTVDLFQGQEEMVIIISLVRSANLNSSQGGMGILGQAERINVAISRARALVIVLGSPETMIENPYLSKILHRAVELNYYIGCVPWCSFRHNSVQ